MQEFDKNIISWYPFEENKTILQIGQNEGITVELKKKLREVHVIAKGEELIAREEKKFDYILIYGYRNLCENLDVILNALEEEGKLLLVDNNRWAINNWSNYKKEKGFGNSDLEREDTKKTTIYEIRQQLESKNIKESNIFFVFPNCENAELIINERFDLKKEQMDKYSPEIEEKQIKTLDESKILKNIIQQDRKLLYLFANAYIIEASRKELKNDIQYVSYNNVRKEEYQLITIIKKEVVEKLPANPKAVFQMNNMKKNIEEMRETNIHLLDYEEEGKIYSQLIQEEKTISDILEEKADDLEEIARILKDMQKDLFINTISYQEAKKYMKYSRVKLEEEKMKKLHFLKKAYIDMVPKNCFYREGNYWYFDQEWKKEYLPIEYITYRSIINSYELVKKIKIQELFKILQIDEYIEWFQELEEEFRREVINQQKLQEIEQKKETSKSVENLVNELKMYQENNDRQDKVIKDLELDNQRKQEYIQAIESENQKKQEEIEALKNKWNLFRRSK